MDAFALKIKEGFFKVFTFLSLLNRDNALSATNVAAWVVIVKMALAPSTGILDIANTFLVLSLYGFKRQQQRKAFKEKTPAQALEQLQAEVESLKLRNVLQSRG